MDMKDSKDFPKSTNNTPYPSGLYKQNIIDYLEKHNADYRCYKILDNLWDEYAKAAIDFIYP